jgi:hypothetical protein
MVPSPSWPLAQEGGGDLGVEQPADPHPGVAVQDAEVVVGVVEHLLHGRVLEQLAERRQVLHRQRVHQEVLRREESCTRLMRSKKRWYPAASVSTPNFIAVRTQIEATDERRRCTAEPSWPSGRGEVGEDAR